MGHKCFISYKKEDKTYKNYLVELFAGQDVIDKSLDRIIDSEDGDYIMETIRNDYLSDSTVTIFLIGQHSSENEGMIIGDGHVIISFSENFRPLFIMESEILVMVY